MSCKTFLLIIFVTLLGPHINSYVVKESEVTFYLRTRNTDTEVQITDDNFANINATKKFHFIIHGWIASHSEEWVQNMTNAHLQQDDCNVVQVDWIEPAAQIVYISANNTKGVGVFIGRFLVRLIEELAVPPENIALLGHSFGGQVSGFAGKEVQRSRNVKIGRITATDPARQPFESSPISESEKLTNEDATVVVVIHTDAGNAGLVKPTGTIDFYPNGGTNPQPGCEDSNDSHTCSHVIVNWFVTEAIENPNGFLAVKCDSYEKYLNQECDGNDQVTLGGDVGDFQGVFYFQTNPQPPYSQN